MANSGKQPISVLHVGPSPDEIGGMAAVMGQCLSLHWGPRYRMIFHATTSSTVSPESTLSRVARHIRHLRSLRLAIAESDAAIVHIHTCSGFSFYRSILDLMIAKSRGCRVILHIHGAAFDAFIERSHRLTRGLIRYGLTAADRVIALSDGWRAKLAVIAPAARISVVENAVVLPDPTPERSNTGRGGPCHFVQLSKMDTWKGVDDLLAACEILHASGCDFHLTLAGPPGSAGDAAALERKISSRKLSSRVSYVGSVVGSIKDSLLREANAFVLASHHEGMPLAMLEALAYGLPVVATKVGAVSEIITEGREGLLVGAHHPHALANAMRILAGDTRHRLEMGVAARRLAESRFCTSRLLERLAVVYDGVSSAGPKWADRAEPLIHT